MREQSPPPGEQHPASSETQEHTAGTDEHKNAHQDGSAFEDALSFRSWDGANAADSPDDTGFPASQETTPPGHGSEEHAAREDAGNAEAKSMSLMEHLRELRSRLVRVLIMIMLGFCACYAVSDTLFGELIKPLTASMPPGSKLIFTSIPEAFFVHVKVGFVASLFLTSPYTFYQLWAFIAPGLYEEERRNIVPLAAFSAFFFLSGASFCYFLVFPIAFDFFMSYATEAILPMPSLDAYLGFALKLLIAFGFICEMPLFAFFLARIGVLTAERLRRWRKYAVLVGVIVGALLTPPDVISQLIMASAILVLYEASIWIVAMAQRRQGKPDATQDAAKANDTNEEANKPAQEAA